MRGVQFLGNRRFEELTVRQELLQTSLRRIDRLGVLAQSLGDLPQPVVECHLRSGVVVPAKVQYDACKSILGVLRRQMVEVVGELVEFLRDEG